MLPAILLLIVTATRAHAQRQAPKPGPELKRLEYFAGDWKSEATMEPGGKFTSTSAVRWMDGGFFLVVQSKFAMQFGAGTGNEVIGYDEKAKTYWYDSFNSLGQHQTATGVVHDDTWVWTSSGMSLPKSRFTEKIISPDSYRFDLEVSNGTGWSSIMKGTAFRMTDKVNR